MPRLKLTLKGSAILFLDYVILIVVTIPENNFDHCSILYCTKVTLYQMR
ncbi:hypothetical protein T12_180 [Trichinella patagoniensis]|uniref:Uncharacterized protein n=1 Tax=Trichinella patagoniensis TaxID=990121 RepID=A0A0V0YX42_9BILA|nr:hypothetical protein T12_180 [Trichinella patagoniensis]